MDRTLKTTEKKENLESDVANMKFDAGIGEDPFVKVKGLVTRLIDKSYCDEETSMAAKKEDLEDDTSKQLSPQETAVPNSTESVNEGHPDNIRDQFSDAVLDACLTCDTKCKVANETSVKDNTFMVTGEITVAGKHETVVRGVTPQLQQTDQVIDVFVVLIVQVQWVRVVAETAEIPQSLSDVRGDVHNIGIDSFIDDLSSVGSTQQQHNNHHRTQWQQARQTEEERKEEKGKEGKRKEKERRAEVKKDVTDWTVVTRNRRQRKMVQIFVKVNGSKVTTMEVNLTDDSRRRVEADAERRGRVCDNTRESAEEKRKAEELRSY